MVEPFTNEMSPDALPHHPAMRAWCELQRAWIEPGRIEALRVEQKAATYRLNGVGPSGASVIAKRCRTATARVERMIYTQFLPRVPVPGLACYGFLQRDFGDLDARIIQRVADCGRLLRLVDELYWASALMTRDTYEFLKRPVVHFRMYEPQLAAALAEGGQGG